MNYQMQQRFFFLNFLEVHLFTTNYILWLIVYKHQVYLYFKKSSLLHEQLFCPFHLENLQHFSLSFSSYFSLILK